jgi:hypothetical protein
VGGGEYPRSLEQLYCFTVLFHLTYHRTGVIMMTSLSLEEEGSWVITTKAVLTVIAASLVLSIHQVAPSASAQIGGQCGLQVDVPCYIKIIP